MLVLLLSVGKHFADGIDDLEEWAFVAADATAHLTECAENP